MAPAHTVLAGSSARVSTTVSLPSAALACRRGTTHAWQRCLPPNACIGRQRGCCGVWQGAHRKRALQTELTDPLLQIVRMRPHHRPKDDAATAPLQGTSVVRTRHWTPVTHHAGMHGRARRTCAARMLPKRARPEPFWAHGLRPPPLTSPRVFVLWVPCRYRHACKVTQVLFQLMHVHRGSIAQSTMQCRTSTHLLTLC